MVSIARKNLWADIPRFLVAQAGIMFAVSLVTIQTGLLNGFTRSTVLLIEGSEADIWVSSERMVQFELTEPLLKNQLDQAQRVKGVERAEALLMGSGRWRPLKGDTSPVKLIGFDLGGTLFQPGKITRGRVKTLKEPYTVMVDQSRLPTLNVTDIGDTATVNFLPARLVGLTTESQSLVASPFVFASLENANTYINTSYTSKLNCTVESSDNLQCTTIYEKSKSLNKSDESEIPEPTPLTLTDPITYIMVKAKLGQDLEQLKQNLEVALPGTRAYTKVEMARRTRNYWQVRTGLGFVLGLGAAVGVIVGMVVVTQILYASVSDHIKEFGTLKAMGAPDRFIYSVIVEQALWMAVLGYVPGMLLCWGLSVWVKSKGIILLITPISATGVFGITVVMCVTSGLFAIQKVTRIDPAIVFKA
ncbi:FtsX-like permease family protein [Moorena bouillonii]|uniref:ABC transporter permease n=1 Tax=Moorena bouillonii PNG TaxID=568701 RepID=A0A1U7N2L6_9CYAN|nr:FtsX-like permease family protein [Moorena bouillonii]OLT60151.1 ABC transporter permease [Moorena bouillonii PNG]